MTGTPEQSPEAIVDEIRWHKLSMRRFEIDIVKAFELFRSYDIEPILIKGWAAAKNYPEYRPRSFGDIDLAVSAVDHDRAVELLTHGSERLAIDLHREFRHLDAIPWETAMARSELANVEGCEVRVLCPEDHLRVLCVHWLNDGGAYKERLWDIYYAVANRPADFDWDICLGSVSETRQRWIVTTIAITYKYLSLDVQDLPFKVDQESIPMWMTRCLEEEWGSDVKLIPLHTCVSQPKLFLQQFLKRVPPNPIEATIEVEGELDERWRFPYQLGSIRMRIVPSIKRVGPVVLSRFRK